MKPKTFAIVGGCGYVGEKHVRALYDLNQEVVAVIDPKPSGFIDQYFPRSSFFTNMTSFSQWADGRKIDYASICSPSYLHQIHTLMCLDLGIVPVCEKPAALNEQQLTAIQGKMDDMKLPVYTVSQMRYHSRLINLISSIMESENNIFIRYVTPRGEWFKDSWKYRTHLSGGIGTHIGYHIFDLIFHLFGKIEDVSHTHLSEQALAGKFSGQGFSGEFFFSTDPGLYAEKIFRINGLDFDLQDEGVLYPLLYYHLLRGSGISLQEAIPVIKFCERIRNE